MRIKLTLAISGLIFLTNCSDDSPVMSTQHISGNDISIEIFNEPDSRSASQLIKETFDHLTSRLDNLLDVNGELERLNKSRELADVSESCHKLLSFAARMQLASSGAWNPFLGGVNSLWALDSDSPQQPEMAEIRAALDISKESRINITSDGAAIISGDGMLALELTALAQSIDDAAAFLIGEGILSGKIVAGGIVRHWGMERFSEEWIIQVSGANENDSKFNIYPEADGALVTVDLHRHGFRLNDTLFYRILNPLTGHPPTEPYSVTIWAEAAVVAAAFAEASIAMGSTNARHWLSDFDEVASFFVLRYEDSYVGEANRKMSEWILTDAN